MKKLAAAAAMVLCAWTMSATAFAAEMKGNWTIAPSQEAGQVQFGMYIRNEGSNLQTTSDWPVAAFQGLDLANRERHDVKFFIARDAGRFDCDGYLNQGEGAGFFRFSPDAKFVGNMRELGFDGIDGNKQFAMAVHDVTLAYARQMKGMNLRGLDTDKLLAFRIFDISQEFIRDLRKEGLAATDADKLIAFRVHGVTPQMVREMRKLGLDTDEDRFIAFRVHGVTPEFVSKIESFGYSNLEPEQLIAMRVHGVTPEFIADMKSRGLKDLSVDKLVALRVHGLD
jgi:hypothetical protein